MKASEARVPTVQLLVIVSTIVSTIVVGCGGDAEPPTERAGESLLGDSRAAPAAFAQVEQALMEGGPRSMEFDVTAGGGFTASLQGVLRFGQGNDLSLEASGVFGADSVSVWLEAEGGVMSWGNPEARDEVELPEGLREGVVIGLTRMGVLHNLARLVSGTPPDGTDGSVRSWVAVEDLRWREDEPALGADGISFRILVAGQSAGSATVWLDSSGAPLGREQVVEFPGGEMRVVERYRWNH
jgi:hypothetical protein